MTDLVLPVKRVYFDQIKAGTKTEEYRLITDFWCARLYSRHYDRIVITMGYPKRDDAECRLVFPYRGYSIVTITHEHFGPDPVTVFSIRLIP